MRPSNEHQRRDLKTMVWGLLDQIGISVFAGFTRVKTAELSKYGALPRNEGDPEERYIPIDVLLDAELRVGDPMVTRLMADIQGFDLVPKGGLRPGLAPLCLLDVLRAQKECSDVTSSYLDGIADGTRDSLDNQKLCREIDEAQIALSELRKRVSA